MRYFSLFAGIGGLEYGFWKSGHECIGFSEIKESSIKIYRKNFGNVRNFGDITKIGGGYQILICWLEDFLANHLVLWERGKGLKIGEGR